MRGALIKTAQFVSGKILCKKLSGFLGIGVSNLSLERKLVLKVASYDILSEQPHYSTPVKHGKHFHVNKIRILNNCCNTYSNTLTANNIGEYKRTYKLLRLNQPLRQLL